MAGYEQMPLESVWTNQSDNDFCIKGQKNQTLWRQRTTRSPSLRRNFRSDTIRYGCIHAHEIELNRLMRAQKIQQFLKSKWDLSEIRTQIEIYFLRFFSAWQIGDLLLFMSKAACGGKARAENKKYCVVFSAHQLSRKPEMYKTRGSGISSWPMKALKFRQTRKMYIRRGS